MTFDYNTWKYLTYSLVSTGNMQKGRNAVLSEMEQEGKVALQAGRPPDRPRPGSRPGASGGRPAPRPTLAGLQAGGVWWVAGPQAGPGRAPGRRPSLFLHDDLWPPPWPTQADLQTAHPSSSNGLISGRGTYTPPSTSRKLPQPKEEHLHCFKASIHQKSVMIIL